MAGKKHYYFDYAATTPLDAKVLSAMMPYFAEKFGNPSNLYELGREAKQAITESTKTITDILGCHPDEFIYTASATESDNMAILGTARAQKDKGNRIIISRVEHKGIISVCDALRKEGFDIVELPVEKDGLVRISELEKALNDKTILVSITYADSETGTIQPIAEIGNIIKNFRTKTKSSLPYFHTDGSQAAAYLPITVEKLGVDLMTLSAHKLYGPKGIGGLYVRRLTKIDPILYGGGQQNRLRSGTENVPGIVGFAQALRISDSTRRIRTEKTKKLRDILERGIFKSIPKVVLNGHKTKRLPNYLNVSILDIEGEAILLHLDHLGIMVNTGSACNSQSLEPSYVLMALGNPYEYIHGSIRFTLGKHTTTGDINYVLKHLPIITKKLRAISPLNLDMNQTASISNLKAFIGGQTPHFLRKKK
jgi:cysteine desulfurase